MLSIDASSSPAIGAVIRIDGNEAIVLEHHHAHLFLPNVSPTQEESTESDVSVPTDSFLPDKHVLFHQEALVEFLARFKTPWTGSIVISSQFEYTSLNLSLPFKDSKSLSKVIDLEVQDVIPFEIDEFLVDHQIVGTISSSGESAGLSDVHVAVAPRKEIGALLGSCQRAGFEPFIITPASSALSGFFLRHPEYAEGQSIVVNITPNAFSIVVCVDGNVRADRTISLHQISPLLEIQRFYGFIERRYQLRIQHLFLTGSLSEADELVTALQISLPQIQIHRIADDFFTDQSTPIPSSLLYGAFFAQETPGRRVLSNFRTREFSYHPHLVGLLRGLKALVPYFTLALVLVVISAAAVYFMRAKELQTLQENLHQKMSLIVPSLQSAEFGEEVRALQQENQKLAQQLRDLGTSSSLTPLDTFAILSREIPHGAGISIRKLSIRTNRLLIEGAAPDYAAVEKIETKFKRKKQVFCHIKKDTSAAASGQPDKRSFSFDMTLCDS